jgi:hypothetical protein
MPKISNKKRKFIKRNCKHLSIEELVDKTGLKPGAIRSFIDQYSAEMPGEGQSAQIKKGALIFPSWKIILLTSLLFAAVASIIYSPSLHGDFVFDDKIIQEKPFLHIERLSQLIEIMVSKEISRRIGYISFALNYYFGGLNTFGYHLVNVIRERKRECLEDSFPRKPTLAGSSHPDPGGILYRPATDQSLCPLLSALPALLY